MHIQPGRRKDDRPSARTPAQLIGFLLVDKPPGPTSHDVVDLVRRRLGVKRVGHAGTLDPPASGLLVLAVGSATRLLSYVQQKEKTYTATGLLGVTTSTLDAAGSETNRSSVNVTQAALENVLPKFTGSITQRPPQVSAIKVAGQRAYKEAAAGRTVEIPIRAVEINELSLVSADIPRFSIRVVCSAGTYIRSLVADIGEALNCGAHVTELRRTSSGNLRVEDAFSLEEISADGLLKVPIVVDLPTVTLDEAESALARNGTSLARDLPEGEVLGLSPGGDAIGVFVSSGGILRPSIILSGD